MDKKIISPHSGWCIGKCPGFCTVSSKLAHGNLSLCFITQLLRFVGILCVFFFIFMPTLCSEGFKIWLVSNVYRLPVKIKNGIEI